LTIDEIQIVIAKLKKMQDWCAEQNWDHWECDRGVFSFATEEQLALFMLRWAGQNE
jgi:hypothetical protein